MLGPAEPPRASRWSTHIVCANHYPTQNIAQVYHGLHQYAPNLKHALADDIVNIFHEQVLHNNPKIPVLFNDSDHLKEHARMLAFKAKCLTEGLEHVALCFESSANVYTYLHTHLITT